MMNAPKISVIIPLYNAEKFFGACLESLLIQTLTDFEVIAVDDCSTDASVAVAESYLEKFGGRMKIITLPQNTGSGSVPRNVGLAHARGKYVYFVDDDDLIIDTALETLYDLAEESGADVVYMEKNFSCDEMPVVPGALDLSEWKPELTDEQIMFEPDDIAVRVEKFLNSSYWCPPWAKFLNRKFLADNNITLPPMKIADDVIWTFKIICLAKKILRIPLRLYIHRENQTSITMNKRTPQQEIDFWATPLTSGAECLDKFMRELNFFKRRSDFRLRVLNYFVTIKFNLMSESFKSLEPTEVYEIFLRVFTAAGSTQPALISYLLVMMNLYRNELSNENFRDYSRLQRRKIFCA